MALKKLFFLWITVFFSASLSLCFVGSVNEIANDFDISLSLAGQIVSLYALSFAILGPLLVKIFGRLSYKKSFIFSIIILIISNILIYYVRDIIVFFGIRIVTAGVASFLITKCFGFITQFSDTEKINKYLAILYTAFATSNTFLIPIFSHVSNKWGWKMVSQVLSVSFIFLISLIMFYVKLDNSPIQQEINIVDNNYSNVKWHKNINVTKLLFATICVLGSNTIFMGYIDPFLTNRGNANDTIPMILFIFGVGGIFGSYLSSKFSDRYSEQKGLKIILTIHSLFFLLIYMVENIYILFLIIFLWSVAQWSSGPMIQKMLINQSNSNRESEKVLSLNMSFINFGISLGGIIGGITIKYSIQLLPLVSMIVAILPVLTKISTSNEK